MRTVVITSWLLALIVLISADNKPIGEIYKFLDQDGDGAVTLDEATKTLNKILPEGDVKDLDVDNDGKITLEEFSTYYAKQYSTWKEKSLS
ncbi:hypothetical protein AAVH_04802 [Aphelenchoides avenae]|nr:hypothetical protein AAVH_04802 [Aphelenchus avenae]